ncbi:MAG: M12 family metallopeptidase [Ornithinimicrobium sp.]
MASKKSAGALAYGGEEGPTSSSPPDVRTGLISGVTFSAKPVQYLAVEGRAMFEGDICLGSVDELERGVGLSQASDDVVALGVGITGAQYRWPGALMPYDIDSSLPNQARVTDAIAHWEANTTMRFVKRTSANASQYPNYVRVFDDGGCYSMLGMRGGMQNLSLGSGCSTGNAIHEFGHAWGLWHEQSREDRDTWVQINWANITSGYESQFNQHISDGDDLGGYDYGSIMHYPAGAFSKNGQPTIVQLKSGPTIGQRTALSVGDIAAVHAMYRTTHYNVGVSSVYSTPHSKNAWAYLAGFGWRKVEGLTTDGVSNTFAVLALARANGRNVHATFDGSTITAAYGA